MSLVVGEYSFADVDRIISEGQLQPYGGNFDSMTIIYNFFEKVLKTKGSGGWIGGNEEESKMRILTLKLLDRIFGEDTTGLKESPDQKSHWKRLPSGGWLRQILNQSNNSKSINLLIDLFSCGNFLIDSLDRRKFSDFEMNLYLFPKKARMLFSKDKEYEFVRSPNQIVYYKLSNSVKQYQNQIDKSQDWRITLQPMEYFIICLVRYPTIIDDIFKTNTSIINNQGNRNNVTVQQNSVVHVLRSSGSQGWISRIPYLHILMKFIEYFIPISDVSSLPTKNADGKINLKKFSEKAEFFIRIATEFWMDGNALIIRREHAQVRRQKIISKASHNLLSHPPPTEVMLLDNSLSLPSTNTIQCMYLLVERLLKEQSLASEYSKLISYNSELQSRDEPLSTPPCINFIQQSLFDMIRLIFSRGRSISSENFSLVVELWLLYLQPWVFEKAKYSSKWDPYIAANFHFYTTLFSCYLQAVAQQDLLTVEDNLNFETLNRVLDVFKDKNLDDVLQKFTKEFLGWYKSRNQSLQLRQASVNVDDVDVDIMHLIRNQHHFLFPDPKIDNFENYGIFDCKEKKQKEKDDMKSQSHSAAAQILTKIHNRLLFLAPQESNRQMHLGEFVDVVTDIGMKFLDFVSTPQKNSSGPRREELLSCQEKLAVILGIEKDIIYYQNSKESNTRIVDRSNDGNCCGDKLSTAKRHEIVEGIIKCDIDNYVYKHDTLISPIRSDEFDILARYLINISLWLNDTYNLPKVKVILDLETVKLSFKEIVSETIKTRSINTAINTFRFNLRPLARISKVLLLLIYFILMLLYCNMLVNLLMISLIVFY